MTSLWLPLGAVDTPHSTRTNRICGWRPRYYLVCPWEERQYYSATLTHDRVTVNLTTQLRRPARDMDSVAVMQVDTSQDTLAGSPAAGHTWRRAVM